MIEGTHIASIPLLSLRERCSADAADTTGGNPDPGSNIMSPLPPRTGI